MDARVIVVVIGILLIFVPLAILAGSTPKEF